MISMKKRKQIQTILDESIDIARKNSVGEPASYIPELLDVPQDLTLAAITLNDGDTFFSGDQKDYRFTLQSVAKLVILAGLLEEFGEKNVFSWVGTESSGHDFSNITHLEYLGPIPANPCVNAGAIALCNYIPGKTMANKLQWLTHWMKQLFNKSLSINKAVYESEKATGYRNVALANLMKSNYVITQDVNEVLDIYFQLCSYEANIQETAYFAAMLSNNGLNPEGKTVLSKQTVQSVVSIMATCGLYDESGRHLIRTGLPAKSGVSGVIIAVVPKVGGISVFSPRINTKGGSIRGHIILEHLSSHLDWHFA